MATIQFSITVADEETKAMLIEQFARFTGYRETIEDETG